MLSVDAIGACWCDGAGFGGRGTERSPGEAAVSGGRVVWPVSSAARAVMVSTRACISISLALLAEEPPVSDSVGS